MQNVKELKVEDMQKINGGSNDVIWGHIGTFAGKQANCIKNNPIKHLTIPGYCLASSLR